MTTVLSSSDDMPPRRSARSDAVAVGAYLTLLRTGRPRRSDPQRALARAAELRARAEHLSGVEQLLAYQHARNIAASARENRYAEFLAAEERFVACALTYALRHAISYEAFREFGVPAPVLTRAGLRPTP